MVIYLLFMTIGGVLAQKYGAASTSGYRITEGKYEDLRTGVIRTLKQGAVSAVSGGTSPDSLLFSLQLFLMVWCWKRRVSTAMPRSLFPETDGTKGSFRCVIIRLR